MSAEMLDFWQLIGSLIFVAVFCFLSGFFVGAEIEKEKHRGHCDCLACVKWREEMAALGKKEKTC